jgi:hypothetical protein
MVFGAAALIALPCLMYVGRTQWFFVDDFDFFADRHLSFVDLMQPHNGHWSTLPILEYRVLYSLFGLREYWAYELVAVVGHLMVAVLLYVVMRRASVQPWIAVAAGVLFLYFGAGWADIVWSFQTGFTGAAAFGLGAVVLSDRRAPDRRRNLCAKACGLAALLCSGVGLAMVVAAGATVLLRRGWKAAFGFAGPLLGVFGVWFVVYGHTGNTVRPSVRQFGAFLWAIVSNPFGQLAHVEGLGWLLAAILGAGAGVASSMPWSDLRARYAAVMGLLVGLAVFVLTTSVTRAWELSAGDGPARASRYAYIGGALVLPAIAAAVSVLARGRPLFVVLAVVILAIGIPGNISLLRPPAATTGDPGALVAAAASHQLADLPARYGVPLPAGGDYITVGWLRQAQSQGKLPSFATTTEERQQATLALTLRLAREVPTNCQPVQAGITIQVTPSQVIAFPVGTTKIRLDHDDTSYTAHGVFDDQYLRTLYGTVQASFDAPVRLCTTSTNP